MIEAVVLGDGGERHQKSLRLLIDAGADKSIADRNGNTPLDLARGRGYEAMVRMLEGK
jgi:ankyrin repeat protein